MNEPTLWWLAAGALIAVELVTGTFYLLMMSLGLVCAALAAHAGASTPWQWVSAAIVGGGSVLAWWFYQKSRPRTAPAESNRDVNMDIGQTVHVTAWSSDNTCSVKYRGAHWDAALQTGQAAATGSHTIVSVVGNRLILQPSPALSPTTQPES